MGKIKDYFKELKEETKKDTEDYDVSDGAFENQVMSELKEDWAEERKDLSVTGGIIIALFLVFILIVGVIYLCFHKQFEKKVNDYIDKIPVYNTDQNNNDNNTQGDNNTDNSGGNNQSNSGTNSNDCSKPFDGVYKLGIEEVTLQSDGYFDKSTNKVTTASGLYRIYNSTVIADVTFEDYTITQNSLTYTISKDCKILTENGTGKAYIRK